jgi:hypothetical protein
MHFIPQTFVWLRSSRHGTISWFQTGMWSDWILWGCVIQNLQISLRAADIPNEGNSCECFVFGILRVSDGSFRRNGILYVLRMWMMKPLSAFSTREESSTRWPKTFIRSSTSESICLQRIEIETQLSQPFRDLIGNSNRSFSALPDLFGPFQGTARVRALNIMILCWAHKGMLWRDLPVHVGFHQGCKWSLQMSTTSFHIARHPYMFEFDEKDNTEIRSGIPFLFYFT